MLFFYKGTPFVLVFIFQNKYYLGEKHIQIRLLDLVLQRKKRKKLTKSDLFEF